MNSHHAAKEKGVIFITPSALYRSTDIKLKFQNIYPAY